MDAQCDKPATVVSQTKLTKLVTIDVPWRKGQKNRLSSTSETGIKFRREVRSTLSFGDTRIPSNTMPLMSKPAR